LRKDKLDLKISLSNQLILKQEATIEFT